MTKILFLDFLREIRHSLNRFLSILCIVAIGVAFFAGLKSASPDMAYTMDAYFDKADVMDLQVISTLGLTQDDIDALAAADGVETVQPGWFADAVTTADGMQLVTRIHSLPDSFFDDGTPCLNRPELVEGRFPTAYNEMVVEASLNRDLGVAVGDRLTFTPGGTFAAQGGELLRTKTFTVVGRVKTPYYLTFDKGTSQLGGKALDMYAYVPARAFSLDYYLEALVTVRGARALDTFSKKYTRTVAEVSATLGNLGTDRAAIRADALRADAANRLKEARRQYEAGKAEFEQQMAEATARLDVAYTELINGEATLKSEKEKQAMQVEYAKEQIKNGKEELASAAEQIDTAQAQVNAISETVNAAQQQYDSAISRNQEYIELLAGLETSLADLTTSMSEIEQQIAGLGDTAEDLEQKQRLETLLERYRQLYAQVDGSYQQIKAVNGDIDGVIQTAGQALSSARAQLASAQNQLDAARAQYAAGQKKITQAQKELDAGQAKAEKEFAAAAQKLEEGRAQYESGKAELEREEKRGESRLAEAEAQLTDAKYAIERIENAEWYIMGRETNYGFVSYKSTVDRMRALAQLLPLFFLLVAVLVCATTMTRMVNEQRGVIGVYKALGYLDGAVIAKYAIYVTAASTVGGVLGAALGTKLFPPAVYYAWAAMYQQPTFAPRVHPGILALSFFSTVAAMALTAVCTCRAELRTVPAQLMRPKAPRAGKTIWLEKLPLVWRRLSFSQKVTARNIFRYKKRLIMTVVGIMGCTALLLASFGMNDTIGRVVQNQYGGVFRYDITVSSAADADTAAALSALLAQSDAAARSAKIGLTSATLRGGGKSETATVYVTSDAAALGDYIALRDRRTGEPLALDDTGLILSEKLAAQLGVKKGDTVEVTNADNIKKSIPVTGVTENYVFHYAYLTQNAYRSYFWQNMPETGTLVCLSDGCTAADAGALCDALSALPGVDSVVSFREAAKNFDEQIRALSSIVVLIIGCAAALAFVVLYNLTNINISERVREIATIKVLGFKNGEVAMYVYRENLVLTLMGAVLGLCGGVGLHRLIMKSIEQSNVMFGYILSPRSYGAAFLLTLAFSVLVMLYMYRGLMRIPMVESLKSVE